MKTIHGAVVQFQAGGEVSEIRLPSDFSTIQITGLPTVANVKWVSDIVLELGYSVPDSGISIKFLEAGGCIAEVKMEDPSFAKLVTKRFEDEKSKHRNLMIKPVLISGAAKETRNRLQLSTVSCTWYKPSRAAWLVYKSQDLASKAEGILKTKEILGRIPDCVVQRPQLFRGEYQCTLQLGNLHPRTTECDISRHLRPGKPAGITMGDPSHTKTDDESARIIERLMRSQGGLESFQWQTTKESNKIKATATFAAKEKAVAAVQAMNLKPVRSLGASKIFLSHVISIKYNILTAILQAIQQDLDLLKNRIWKDSHLHLKVYPQADPNKPFTALRLFGEDLKSIPAAKSELENILAGNVIMNGDSVLWDPYFLGPSSLLYLNELSRAHKTYIYRDLRKSQLVLYCCSVPQRLAIEQILVYKITSIRSLTHIINLDAELLNKAMRGGMRRLKARFGNTVLLNVSTTPKKITLSGSAGDFLEAQTLLIDSDDHSARVQKDDDCVVCWTQATEALTTSCGHCYCTDCFSNQVSSTETPIRCFGAEGTCEHIFSINELKMMLPHAELERVLETSFEKFIRTRPKNFQFCPTPDCLQIYRPSDSGEEFFCSSCLSTICTTCKVISHEGVNCDDYKDLNSEGSKAFQKWKKENDARDCPNCKAVIQKTYGCNHMECRQCRAHICWFCMATFSTGPECYGHMREKHQSYY